MSGLAPRDQAPEQSEPAEPQQDEATKTQGLAQGRTGGEGNHGTGQVLLVGSFRSGPGVGPNSHGPALGGQQREPAAEIRQAPLASEADAGIEGVVIETNVSREGLAAVVGELQGYVVANVLGGVATPVVVDNVDPPVGGDAGPGQVLPGSVAGPGVVDPPGGGEGAAAVVGNPEPHVGVPQPPVVEGGVDPAAPAIHRQRWRRGEEDEEALRGNERAVDLVALPTLAAVTGARQREAPGSGVGVAAPTLVGTPVVEDVVGQVEVEQVEDASGPYGYRRGDHPLALLGVHPHRGGPGEAAVLGPAEHDGVVIGGELQERDLGGLHPRQVQLPSGHGVAGEPDLESERAERLDPRRRAQALAAILRGHQPPGVGGVADAYQCHEGDVEGAVDAEGDVWSEAARRQLLALGEGNGRLLPRGATVEGDM